MQGMYYTFMKRKSFLINDWMIFFFCLSLEIWFNHWYGNFNLNELKFMNKWCSSIVLLSNFHIKIFFFQVKFFMKILFIKWKKKYLKIKLFIHVPFLSMYSFISVEVPITLTHSLPPSGITLPTTPTNFFNSILLYADGNGGYVL